MRICVDLHTHSHFSLDAKYSPEEMARGAAERGIDAIAICDHNAWDIFAAMPENSPALILPAVEYSTTSGHIVGLFMESPPTLTYAKGHYYDPSKVVEAIHQKGGLAIAAHPFPREEEREMGMHRIALCDGVEVFNARAMATWEESLRETLGQAGGKFRTAGSDSHSPGELGGARLYLTVEECSPAAIREALLRDDGVITGYPGSMAAKARADYKKAKTTSKKLRARCKIAAHWLWDRFRRSAMNTRYTVELKTNTVTKENKRRDLCR